MLKSTYFILFLFLLTFCDVMTANNESTVTLNFQLNHPDKHIHYFSSPITDHNDHEIGNNYHVKNSNQNEYSPQYTPAKQQIVENYSSEHILASNPVERDHQKSNSQEQVPIIQTHHHFEPVIRKEQYQTCLKHHHLQYLKDKKDLLHYLHPTKQASLQYGVGYRQNPLKGYSHLTAQFKSRFTGDLQIFPTSQELKHKKNEGSEENSMRKKESVKGKLGDAIFEHIMTKYLHHGTPLHTHKHGTSAAGLMPYYVHRNRKQPPRKIDFHLGIPALSLILHIRPILSNHSSPLLNEPTVESSNTLVLNPSNTTFSKLSMPTHGLFFNSSLRPKIIAYEVHEDANISQTADDVTVTHLEPQTENTSIIKLLKPSNKLQQDNNRTKLNNITYDTLITTPSVGETVHDEAKESKQDSRLRDSLDSTTQLVKSLNRSTSETEQVSKTESYDEQHENQNEYKYEVIEKSDVVKEGEEDSFNFKNSMDDTTEVDDSQVEPEIDVEEETTAIEDEFETEASTDAAVGEDYENLGSQELSSNGSQPDNLMIRASRLVIPNQLQRLDDLPSDIPHDDAQDALLPVIPIIIHDLREGRVSNSDRNILSQVFGDRWANIEMRASKESVNIDLIPHRLDRTSNITQGESKNNRSKRSSEYLDVLSEYFEDRHKEDEDYAYEDDSEWEEGPDVTQLLQVAQAHINWKTHHDLQPK